MELGHFFETGKPAGLGPGPRPGVQSQTKLEEELELVLGSSSLPAEHRDLIRALVLLWHDHLDAAHRIAQEIDNPDGAFVHGIMHRREPDFGNAAYWFRRVGRHPAYAQIASRVAPILEKASPTDFTGSLIRNGLWDPFAFIDACERVSGKSDPAEQLLQEIQRQEFGALLAILESV